jgi:hypothetical protein
VCCCPLICNDIIVIPRCYFQLHNLRTHVSNLLLPSRHVRITSYLGHQRHLYIILQIHFHIPTTAFIPRITQPATSALYSYLLHNISNMTGGLSDTIRKGVGKVHGTGEALRGEFNATIDKAAGDKAGATKNEEIAQKGVDEFDRGYQGHGNFSPTSSPSKTSPLTLVPTATGSKPPTGVGHHAPHTSGAAAEYQNTTSASSNYGPHATNAGNKLDPRYDSDMDHRGIATGSTNVGTHSNNVANKLDPRFDSDADHRANPTSGMGPSAGYAGTSATGSTNAGHHQSNLANKLDPMVDSDQDHRANPNSNMGIQGAGAGGVGGVGSTNAGPHKSNLGNAMDPRVDSDMDNRGNPASNVGGTGAGYR